MHFCFPPIVADVHAPVARGDAAAVDAGTAPISAIAAMPASTRVRITWFPFRSDSSVRSSLTWLTWDCKALRRRRAIAVKMRIDWPAGAA
jgi:hypothetical protein